MKRVIICSVCTFASVCLAEPTHSQQSEPPTFACQEIRRYDVSAVAPLQGVAVDQKFIYAIGLREIDKHDKDSGLIQFGWNAPRKDPTPVIFNAGRVREGKLYCTRSNYPEFPNLSAVEIWNVSEMRHVDSHSFGIETGWLTWLDWYDGAWWGVFANYTENVGDNPHGCDTRWTSLIRFDDQWRRTGGWVFPRGVIERLQPQSCCGGAWGPNGRLYCTGHDRGEIYELHLPIAGSTLYWSATYTAPITGGGICWDPTDPRVLYGIDREKREVVVFRTPKENVEDAPAEPQNHGESAANQ